MDLTDKIKQILADKNLTPSLFADEIGIQRPSMSHILAGRNKPSLDIVQKIVKRFPELGLNWILDDQDLPPRTDAGDLPGRKIPAPTTVQASRIRPAKSEISEQKVLQTEGKKVDRILIFYTDGTYKEFKEV